MCWSAHVKMWLSQNITSGGSCAVKMSFRPFNMAWLWLKLHTSWTGNQKIVPRLCRFFSTSVFKMATQNSSSSCPVRPSPGCNLGNITTLNGTWYRMHLIANREVTWLNCLTYSFQDGDQPLGEKLPGTVNFSVHTGKSHHFDQNVVQHATDYSQSVFALKDLSVACCTTFWYYNFLLSCSAGMQL